MCQTRLRGDVPRSRRWREGDCSKVGELPAIDNQSFIIKQEYEVS